MLLKCQLCEYRAKQLHQHIKAVHKITSTEYRKKFGHVAMQTNFDHTKKVVDDYHSEYVKGGYKKLKASLKNLGTYSLIKTQRVLKTTWKKYLGKAKWRTLIKDDPKLYNSIIYYSETINRKTTLEEKMKFILFFDADIKRAKCFCKRRVTMGKNCRYCSNHYYKHQSKTGFLPAYNKAAIPIIEAVAMDYGVTDIQHAENIGEFTICGYYLDGYSESENIAFEYDERHHFKEGKLKPRDIKRMLAIKDILGCKFVRISEQGEINEY